MNENIQKFQIAAEVTLLFILIYFGTSQLAAYSQVTHPVYMNWELALPRIDAFWYIYISIFAVMFAPAFLLDLQHLRKFAHECKFAIIFSGLFFLLWPTSLAYQSALNPSELNLLASIVRALDGPFNAFPSLHVSLATICTAHLVATVASFYRLAVGSWLFLTYLSVIFTHQHHIADIFGGMVVAFLVSTQVRSWCSVLLLPKVTSNSVLISLSCIPIVC